MSPQEAERLIQNSGTTLYLDIERLVTIENQLDFDNMDRLLGHDETICFV